MGSNAKITILGSGTSTGVPVLGCACNVCQSSDDKNKRTRASIMIEVAGGPRIVIDTGPDFRTQMLRSKVNALEHVLFTHCHADHLHGFDDLRAFDFTSQKAIHCYLHPENEAELRQRFSYAFEVTGYLGGRPDLRIISLPNSSGKISIEGLEIESIRLPHGNVMTNAFRFGKFAYATDFKMFPDDILELWRGKIHCMVASGLRWREHPTHSSLPETLELFKALGVQKGYVSHLSHEIEYVRDSQKMPQNVALVYDGMEIEVEI